MTENITWVDAPPPTRQGRPSGGGVWGERFALARKNRGQWGKLDELRLTAMSTGNLTDKQRKLYPDIEVSSRVEHTERGLRFRVYFRSNPAINLPE